MKQKTRQKSVRHYEDLDQRTDAFYIQNEEEKERAFVELIAEIIVQMTLREYYETMDKGELPTIAI